MVQVRFYFVHIVPPALLGEHYDLLDFFLFRIVVLGLWEEAFEREPQPYDDLELSAGWGELWDFDQIDSVWQSAIQNRFRLTVCNPTSIQFCRSPGFHHGISMVFATWPWLSARPRKHRKRKSDTVRIDRLIALHCCMCHTVSCAAVLSFRLIVGPLDRLVA